MTINWSKRVETLYLVFSLNNFKNELNKQINKYKLI